MNLQKRIDALARLGYFMRETAKPLPNPVFANLQEQNSFDKLELEICQAKNYNGWFTENNVRQAIGSLGEAMTKEKLEEWAVRYGDKLINHEGRKQVGIVMAGNIPAVGFHDLLCVLLTGNNALAKMSSGDNRLIPALIQLLIAISPDFDGVASFTKDRLTGFDAIIATGSNNASRYFEFYFGKYPHIIRKNRNGVAVLTGRETSDELDGLSFDISAYYGLGCRNVTHLFVPEQYDFIPLLDALSQKNQNTDNSHYFNNYEYHKAILLVNGTTHFDTGGLLLTENPAIPSSVSIVHYSTYHNIEQLSSYLKTLQDQIQCVVSNPEIIPHAIPMGTSQQPELWDYADGIDTIDFLLNIS